MSRIKTSFTESQINARIKKGYGCGEGSQYIPWLKVQDVPSLGRSHRVYSHKTKRVHHLLSDLELTVFLLLEYEPNVLDIREQFPLKIEETIQIANQKQIKHPNIRGINQVMSSDFLITYNSSSLKQFAIQVKPSDSLTDIRTIEKLEIERSYWKKKEIPWFIFTNREINLTVKQNIEWLYATKSIFEDSINLLDQIPIFNNFFQKHPQKNVNTMCKQMDIAYQLDAGQTLYYLRSLIANGLIKFNIHQKFHECKCIDMMICTTITEKELFHVAS